MSALRVIALLRPEGSRAVPLAKGGELAESLLADDGARLVSHGTDEVVVAIDVGEGRNVFVAIRPKEIRLDASLHDGVFFDEEHGTEEDDPAVNEAVYEVADAVVRQLQARTGWGVTSDHLLGFDPIDCPSCERTCFEWQERCMACGAWLDPGAGEHDDEGPPADHEDEQAEAIVRTLLKEELLELVSPSSSAGLCSRLAAYLAFEGVTSGGVLDVLVDSNDVAEVYATEGDLDRIIDGDRPG